MADNTSEFLVAAGWRPSPTTFCFSAWEHPGIKVPDYVGTDEGLYCADRVRVPPDVAVLVQLIIDRAVEDGFRERLSLVARTVDVVTEIASKMERIRAR